MLDSFKPFTLQIETNCFWVRHTCHENALNGAWNYFVASLCSSHYMCVNDLYFLLGYSAFDINSVGSYLWGLLMMLKINCEFDNARRTWIQSGMTLTPIQFSNHQFQIPKHTKSYTHLDHSQTGWADRAALKNVEDGFFPTSFHLSTHFLYQLAQGSQHQPLCWARHRCYCPCSSSAAVACLHHICKHFTYASISHAPDTGFQGKQLFDETKCEVHVDKCHSSKAQNCSKLISFNWWKEFSRK